jgi:hypothetical protein
MSRSESLGEVRGPLAVADLAHPGDVGRRAQEPGDEAAQVDLPAVGASGTGLRVRHVGRSDVGLTLCSHRSASRPSRPRCDRRANAFAERFVSTMRTECLDHLLVLSRRHLEAVIAPLIDHYNRVRPHRGLKLAQPHNEAGDPDHQ